METLKTIWDFFQNEVLGMNWLNRLIETFLNACGLDTTGKIGGSVQFFIYDMILSRLVDTFISRISLTMLPVPNPHNTVCVLSWEEARHWQSRSSGYSSS